MERDFIFDWISEGRERVKVEGKYMGCLLKLSIDDRISIRKLFNLSIDMVLGLVKKYNVVR